MVAFTHSAASRPAMYKLLISFFCSKLSRFVFLNESFPFFTISKAAFVCNRWSNLAPMLPLAYELLSRLIKGLVFSLRIQITGYPFALNNRLTLLVTSIR